MRDRITEIMKHNQTAVPLVGMTVLLAVLTMTVASYSGPEPGYADIAPAGTWSERWTGYYRAFEVGDGLSYRVESITPYWWEYADDTGNWDWIREYANATIWLKNIPGTSWYSPSDTNLDFWISIPTLTVKLRNPEGASIDPYGAYGAYLEMEVSAHASNIIFLATYMGCPIVTNVPETPDVIAFTMASGVLASARMALSLPDRISGAAGLGIRPVPGSGSGIELSWNSATNRLYQVQYCSDLATGDWTDAASPGVGTGAELRARGVIGPDETQGFYRVLEFP